jgi:hypothetical protein
MRSQRTGNCLVRFSESEKRSIDFDMFGKAIAEFEFSLVFANAD